MVSIQLNTLQNALVTEMRSDLEAKIVKFLSLIP